MYNAFIFILKQASSESLNQSYKTTSENISLQYQIFFALTFGHLHIIFRRGITQKTLNSLMKKLVKS
jgi:hypothetical protein